MRSLWIWLQAEFLRARKQPLIFQHPPHLQFHFSLETLSLSLALPAAALVCAIIMPAGSKK